MAGWRTIRQFQDVLMPRIALGVSGGWFVTLSQEGVVILSCNSGIDYMICISDSAPSAQECVENLVDGSEICVPCGWCADDYDETNVSPATNCFPQKKKRPCPATRELKRCRTHTVGQRYLRRVCGSFSRHGKMCRFVQEEDNDYRPTTR
jgi:hypothetical protein